MNLCVRWLLPAHAKHVAKETKTLHSVTANATYHESQNHCSFADLDCAERIIFTTGDIAPA